MLAMTKRWELSLSHSEVSTALRTFWGSAISDQESLRKVNIKQRLKHKLKHEFPRDQGSLRKADMRWRL